MQAQEVQAARDRAGAAAPRAGNQNEPRVRLTDDVDLDLGLLRHGGSIQTEGRPPMADRSRL